MPVTDPNELLDDVLFKGVLNELFRAEQYWALGREVSRNASKINQTRAKYLFGDLQSLFGSQITLALNKALEPVNPRYPIRSIPVALDILRRHSKDLKLFRRDFLIEKLIAYGFSETDLAAMSNSQITETVLQHFSANLPASNNSDDLSQALTALKAARDKSLAHHEAVDVSSIPKTTFQHVYDLIGYLREFLTTVGSGYTNLRYSDDSDWFFGNNQSEDLASDLKWVLERAGLTCPDGAT